MRCAHERVISDRHSPKLATPSTHIRDDTEVGYDQASLSRERRINRDLHREVLIWRLAITVVHGIVRPVVYDIPDEFGRII